MSIFTEEYFKNMEESECIGILAKDHKDNVIYQTDRKIYVEVKIKNKSELKRKKPEAKKWMSLQTFDTLPIALVDSEKNEAYTGENENCKLSDLKGKNMILIDAPAGVDVKTAFEKRMRDFKEVCKTFDLDEEKMFNHEVVIARRLAYNTLSEINGCEYVTKEENIQIDGSVRGALTYFEKTSVADCYDYDVNSLYPFCMSKTDFRFPLRIAEKKKVKSNYKIKVNPTKRLEIYKLKILGTHKYWRDTKDNYYNTYHIEILNLLGIEYEIDGNSKWVYNEPVKSSNIFSYFDKLYELKANNNKFAKMVMSSTWGALSREKAFEVRLEDLKETSLNDIVQIRIDKGYAVLNSSLSNEPYKFKTARLKSFLLAYARLFMLKNIVLPLEERGHHVYLVNTDAVVTNANPDQMNFIYPISDAMGDLKIEKELKGVHDIVHLRSIQKQHDIFEDIDD